MVDSAKITITATAPLTVGSISINASALTVVVPGSVTITGVVTSTTGVVMSGLTVYLFEQTTPGGAFTQVGSTTTNASGAYSFVGNFTVAGTFTYDVSSDTSNV